MKPPPAAGGTGPNSTGSWNVCALAMLRERTRAGMDAARRQGRVGGRRPKLSPQQQAEIRMMVGRGDKTAGEAARLFRVHPATISRLLAHDPSLLSNNAQ